MSPHWGNIDVQHTLPCLITDFLPFQVSLLLLCSWPIFLQNYQKLHISCSSSSFATKWQSQQIAPEGSSNQTHTGYKHWQCWAPATRPILWNKQQQMDAWSTVWRPLCLPLWTLTPSSSWMRQRWRSSWGQSANALRWDVSQTRDTRGSLQVQDWIFHLVHTKLDQEM